MIECIALCGNISRITRLKWIRRMICRILIICKFDDKNVDDKDVGEAISLPSCAPSIRHKFGSACTGRETRPLRRLGSPILVVGVGFPDPCTTEIPYIFRPYSVIGGCICDNGCHGRQVAAPTMRIRIRPLGERPLLRYLPISARASSKQRMTKSMSSLVWLAQTCVRILARPLGTTG